MRFFWLKTASFCALLALLNACTEDRSEVTALESSTMELHDEAMKALGAMNTATRKRRAELEAADSLSQNFKDMKAAIAAAERAEADMMDWMQQYTSPPNEMPKAEAVNYLKGQKEKMEKNLRDIMAANKLLNDGR